MTELRRAESLASRSLRSLAWGVLLLWLSLGCQVLFGAVKVTQSSGAEAGCSKGDVRCNGQYLLVCGAQATGWTLQDTCASGDLCDAKDKRCSQCRAGDARCDGVLRQQCTADGSSWQTVETCAAANLCSESSCAGCLTDGALDCSVAPLLRRCQAGVWVTLDTCVSKPLCDATTAYAMTAADWDQKCVAPGCPVAGQYRCDGTTLERCPPAQDAWMTVDTCASAALCANVVAAVNSASDPNAVSTLDSCPAGCPNAGAFNCAGGTLQQCRTDQTGYDIVTVCGANTECDPIAGDCGQLCTAGQYQCNGATLRKCGSNGHWVDQSNCETAALCVVSADSTVGSCTPSPCGDSAYACAGSTLQKCKADRTGYDDYQSCASAALCDAASARCVAATCPSANAYQCFGQDLKQCSTDLTTWNAVTTCPAGQLCNSGANPDCLTSCPANPVRCNGKVLEHCAAATGWTTQATCSTPDLCTCTLTDPDGSGPLTNSCLGGLYKDGCGNVVCGVSKANFQCQGAELQKCQAGRNGWDDVAACGQAGQTAAQAAALCYPGEAPTYTGGYCLTCPVAGELACNGSTLRVCSDDRRSWNTSQSCAKGCVAVQNGQDYCAACKAGAVQCVSATLQSCPTDERAWTSTACNSAALCDAAHDQCDVCTQTVCAGNVLEKCTNGGQTLQNQTCASVCDATNAQCDKCAAGSIWCSDATLNKCSADGQTQTMTTCQTAGLCDATKGVCTAPTCSVGQTRCVGAQPEVCNTARTGWDNATSVCATAALCNGATGTCTAPSCDVGQQSCGGADNATLQSCNAGRNGWTTLSVCASSALCDPAKPACVAPTCSAGQGHCSGAQPQICSTDLTKFIANGAPCATVALCDPKTFTCDAPACAVGEQRCSGSNLQICNADRTAFIDGTECGAPGCNKANNSCNTAICTAGAFQCAELTLEQCNAAGTAWSAVQTCLAICDAPGGECDDCLAPQFNCMGNTLQTCSASGHWLNTDCLTNVCDAQQGTCDVPADQ